MSLAAAQFALLTGARVILTSSSQAKLDRAKTLLQPLIHPDAPETTLQTIDYSKVDDWDKEARKLNGGQGVDFVIEIAGRGTIARSIRSTRMAGLVAVSGMSLVPPLDDLCPRVTIGQDLTGRAGYMSDYKPIPKHILDEDLAKTILYSAANVRGVFVCNREEFKQANRALEIGGVKPIIDKVSARSWHNVHRLRMKLMSPRCSNLRISKPRISTWRTENTLARYA